MLRLTMLALALLVCAASQIPQAHAQLAPVQPTGKPYAIVITDAPIDGLPLQSGDEVAVYDGALLVGRAVYENSFPLMLTAWQGDPGRDLPGFVAGQPLIFRVYGNRYGSWRLLEADVDVVVGDGTFGFGSYSTVRLQASTSDRPELTLDGTALDFGPVRVGDTRTMELVLQNAGSAPLTLFGISPDGGQFQVSTGSAQIQPGGKLTLLVTYVPTAALPSSAQLVIDSDDPSRTRTTVPIHGQGLPATAPVLVTDPVAVDFGSVQAGQQVDRSLIVSNRGNDTLRISSVTSSSPNFLVDPLARPLGPGESALVTIKFSAASQGLHNAVLTFQSNSANSTNHQVSLSATAHQGHYTPPVPTGVTFPVVLTSIKVDNAPLLPGDEVALYAAGQVVGHAAFNGSLPFTVFANQAVPSQSLRGYVVGDSIAVRVQTRRYGADVDVSVDVLPAGAGQAVYGVGAFAAISVTGSTGRAPRVGLDFSPLVFQDTPVHQEAAEIIRWVRNDGSSSLVITPQVTGDFAVHPMGTRSVASGDSIAYAVRFNPSAVGIRDGRLALHSDDPYSPLVELTAIGRGTILVPHGRVTVTAPDWLVGRSGEDSEVDLSITNQYASREAVTIDAQAIRGSAHADRQQVELAPNATANLRLTFRPALVGVDTVSVVVHTSDGSQQVWMIPMLGHDGRFGKAIETGKSYFLVFEEITAPGVPFEPGDEVAVFDGDVLVGVHHVRGTESGFSIPVWERDLARGLPGYEAGSPISVRFSKRALGFSGPQVLDPFSLTFSGSGTFGDGAIQGVRAVVREPLYFRNPGRRVTYERDEFLTRTFAHVDSLVHAPNRQPLTHTLTSDSEGLRVSRVGNFVRLQLEPGFTGPVEVVHSVTDGVEALTDTVRFDVVLPPPVNISVPVQAGWNLVGLSAELGAPASFDDLYPGSIPHTAFGFNGAYGPAEHVENGRGYWLRFDGERNTAVEGITLRRQELQLRPGWNLISGISTPVMVGNLIDPSRAVISGTLYEYSGAYKSASVIESGRGYWLRASREATVTIVEGSSNPAASAEVTIAGHAKADFGAPHRILVTYGDTVSTTLHFGSQYGAHSENVYFPPRPPNGAFDVRFSDDSFVATSDSVMVLVQGGQLPVSIQLQSDNGVFSYEAFDGDRLLERGTLNVDEVLTISSITDRISIFATTPTSVSNPSLVAQWHMGQNYPNPFSHATSIPVSVPRVAHVELSVYDLLGRRVLTMIDGILNPGRHVVELAADNLVPGIYLYKLEADGYRQTGRMVIVR